MKHRIAIFKPLAFLPMLLLLALIFSFSAQTGTESGSLSYEVSLGIAKLHSALLHLNKSALELAQTAGVIHTYVRKAAHMTEYALLALSILFPLTLYRWNLRRKLLVTPLFCAAVAASDEFHQVFVAGRGPSVRDVGIDCGGAFLGIGAFCLLLWVIRRIRK